MARSKAWPCSVADHIPTLPSARSRVWVRVRASYREGMGRNVARNQAWSQLYIIQELITSESARFTITTLPLSLLPLLQLVSSSLILPSSILTDFIFARSLFLYGGHRHTGGTRTSKPPNGVFHYYCSITPRCNFVILTRIKSRIQQGKVSTSTPVMLSKLRCSMRLLAPLGLLHFSYIQQLIFSVTCIRLH